MDENKEENQFIKIEEDNNIEKKNENNDTTNNIVNDDRKADQLTDIANILIFIIPIIIWLMGFLFMFDELVFVLKRYVSPIVSPISILAGLTLLIYIRIKYPNNLKSKKLVKTVIIAAIVITLLLALLITTCYNMLSRCEGFPG